MIKTSFTVSYRKNGVRHIILGVTSIVPNLNGLLLFTEDGKGYQIESDVLASKDFSPQIRLFVEYSNDEDINDEIGLARDYPDEYKVYDHRSK